MQEPKQIIVAGASTSGKTTFATELVRRYFLQHIQIDPIIDAFESVFPEHGITHHAPTVTEHQQVCAHFEPFVVKMIESLPYTPFVIEGFRMPIEALYDRFGTSHQLFVFGFPNATPTDKVLACRDIDVVNWTTGMSDSVLEDVFAFMIEESKREEAICAKHNIPFIDTSSAYWAGIARALTLVR